jgi:hypothetical protein
MDLGLSGRHLRQYAIALLDMCDTFADFVDLAGHVSAQNVGVFL